MKTKLFLATMMMAGIANAQDASGDLILFSTSIPTAVTSVLPSEATSRAANKNDMVMVQADAHVALETGFISSELDSVIQKIRASNPDMAGKTVEEIIEVILSANQ